MQVIRPGKHPIKMWDTYVNIEPEAREQVENLAEMPFIHKHVAVMPDAHWGLGSTVGSVFCTTHAIIPAAVGVDIGCGMMAVRTPLKASLLPDDLSHVRSQIEKVVPHGRTNNGREGDRGAWHVVPANMENAFAHINNTYKNILAKHPSLKPHRHPTHHMGTLGTGNHFIEVCIDEDQDVWIMLHSGSRGIGNKIGNYFISKAKEEMNRYYITDYLPDENLSYLVEHSRVYDDYIEAVNWAQEYALWNRRCMMLSVLDVFKERYPELFKTEWLMETAVNCHHNYVSRENHFNKSVWVTRKGAVSARTDQMGIIPGSMGAKSYIVRGKGNPDSFHSCSHGAGRAMSRNQAKKRFTLEDHIAATQGVECRKDVDVIDETPMAYKDIDAVMQSQLDLVEIVHTLKQVVCVKG